MVTKPDTISTARIPSEGMVFSGYKPYAYWYMSKYGRFNSIIDNNRGDSAFYVVHYMRWFDGDKMTLSIDKVPARNYIFFHLSS